MTPLFNDERRFRPGAAAATRWSLAGAALAALTLAACATRGEPPRAQLAVAHASLTQAQGAGADQLAAVEFVSAREKLQRADTAMQAEHYADARRLSEEASADADLAEHKARAVKAQRAAEALQRSNAMLSQEANRNARP